MGRPQPETSSPSLYDLAKIDPILQPIEPSALITLLSRLALHYPLPKMSDEQFGLYWRDYVIDLGHLPEHLIERAIVAYRTRIPAEMYFPKSAQLLECADRNSHRIAREQAYAEFERRQRPAAPPPMPPEERVIDESQRLAVLTAARLRRGEPLPDMLAAGQRIRSIPKPRSVTKGPTSDDLSPRAKRAHVNALRVGVGLAPLPDWTDEQQ